MSQKLRTMLGQPALQDILKYQEDILRKEGYAFKSSVDFETHCQIEVTRGQWFFSVAITHDGSREDAQCAADECSLDIFDAAWNHFRTGVRTKYR